MVRQRKRRKQRYLFCYFSCRFPIQRTHSLNVTLFFTFSSYFPLCLTESVFHLVYAFSITLRSFPFTLLFTVHSLCSFFSVLPSFLFPNFPNKVNFRDSFAILSIASSVVELKRLFLHAPRVQTASGRLLIISLCLWLPLCYSHRHSQDHPGILWNYFS